MGFPGLFVLGFRRKIRHKRERTLGVSASGGLVPVYDEGSSGDCTTREGNEVGGLLVFPSEISC